MKKTAVFVVSLAILTAAWFFVSPLFIDKAVNEDADFLLDGGRLDIAAIMSMPVSEREEMRQEIMTAAAGAPPVNAAEPMPAGTPQVVARGRFIDADAVHKGSGESILYALPDGSHVLRLEDFRTTNGPALVVYLAKHPSPGKAADVSDGGFLSLGKLKGNVGNQNYVVPAGSDIAQYRSVVIWCELFGVLFSPAALSGI